MIVIISGVWYMNWHLDKDFRNGLMQGIISEMKSSYKKNPLKVMWASGNHKLLCSLVAGGWGEVFIMGGGMLRLCSVAKPHCIKSWANPNVYALKSLKRQPTNQRNIKSWT